jgi:hypothetical protein
MGISSRPAGFRFSDEEYGLMDKLKFHFWPLFPTRKAVLSAALRAFSDASFMERTFADAIHNCQRALCAQRESSQMRLRFPGTVELRPRFGRRDV